MRFTYFAEITNCFEVLSHFLNIFLIVNEWTDRKFTNNDFLKFFAVFCIAFVWFKVFYWMRIYEEHAFFTKLITKTLYGIYSFTSMLILLLCALANVLYIISKVDHDPTLLQDDGKMPRILNELFDNDAVNAVIHMYLLSLGEFDYGDF